jgi:hypothetical protein
MTQKLFAPAVPNFPNGGIDYEQRYQNELNNIHRLYLDRLNFVVSQLVSTNSGGKFLFFPHIAASDSTDQYATADDTPTVVEWNTLDSGLGFTLDAPGSATPSQTGIYKITFSIQLANTANAIHDAVFWLRIDGVDLPNSTTFFTVPARKGAGNPSYICAYSEVTFPINALSVVELVWATDQAYNPVGPVDGVYLFADAAQTSPYARPAIPSAIGSITFVSGI